MLPDAPSLIVLMSGLKHVLDEMLNFFLELKIKWTKPLIKWNVIAQEMHKQDHRNTWETLKHVEVLKHIKI